MDAKRVLKDEMGIDNPTEEDCRTIREVCTAVSIRAARLAAGTNTSPFSCRNSSNDDTVLMYYMSGVQLWNYGTWTVVLITQ